MKSIIVHVSKATEWSPEELLLSMGGVHDDKYDLISLEKEGDALIVSAYHDMMIEYEEDDLNLVHSLVGNPTSYLVEWRGEHLLRQFLNAIPRNSSVAVDDNCWHMVLFEPNTQISNILENMRQQAEKTAEIIRKQAEGMRNKRGLN